MCTLLKVANKRPVNLISPFFVHEEQITSVGSTSDNSAALARFSCTVRVFSALSTFFTRFPSFGTLAVRAALRTRTAPAADYLPTSSEYFFWLPIPTCWWWCTPRFVCPQCGLCASWFYTSKVCERWEIAVLYGRNKLYAILPDLVAHGVKLDLAKHFHVLLCRSYERETSILLVAADGFYSPDKRLKDIREVRDEERLVTLLVWRHGGKAGSWEPTRSSNHQPGPKFFRKLTGPTQRGLPKGWALSMSPSSEDIPILALGCGVKVVYIANRRRFSGESNAG